MNRILRFMERHELICLFGLFYLVYNLNGRAVTCGDTIPASLLPFSILKDHVLYLDLFSNFFQSIGNPDFIIHKDGHCISFFPIVVPVLVTPLYAIPYLLLEATHYPIDPLNPGFWLVHYLVEKLAASFIASTSGVFVFLSLRELTTSRAAIAAALIYAFGTNTWVTGSQALWQHGMTELLLAITIYLVILHIKRGSDLTLVFLGLISSFFVFNRIADSLLLLPMIYYISQLKLKKMAIYAGSMALPSSLFLAYNFHFFGNALGGYFSFLPQLSLSYSTLTNMIGLMVSPSRGLFIYSPILIISLFGLIYIPRVGDRRISKFLYFSGLSVLADVLIYSAFREWHGGMCYGPRFLAGTLPVLAVYLGLYLNSFITDERSSRQKTAILIMMLLLLSWSVFVQVVGAFYYYPNTSWDLDFNPAHLDKVWDWNDTQIMRSFHDGPILISPMDNLRNMIILKDIIVPKGDVISSDRGSRPNITITLGQNWYLLESSDGINSRWISNDAGLLLFSEDNSSANLSMRASSFLKNRTLEFYLGGILIDKSDVPTVPVKIRLPVHLIKGRNELKLHVDGGCEAPYSHPELNNEDRRCLSLNIRDVSISRISS